MAEFNEQTLYGDARLSMRPCMDEDDDIVSNLYAWADIIDGVQGVAVVMVLSGDVHREAAAEIVRLRAALAVASGLISTMPQYEHEHPEAIMQMLLEEASHG